MLRLPPSHSLHLRIRGRLRLLGYLAIPVSSIFVECLCMRFWAAACDGIRVIRRNMHVFVLILGVSVVVRTKHIPVHPQSSSVIYFKAKEMQCFSPNSRRLTLARSEP